MRTKQVKDWMTAKVITVSSHSTLPDAYWLMLENEICRLPVVDDGTLVGMVTIDDLRRAEPPAGAGLDLVKINDRLSKMTIRQMMTKEVKTISSAASLMDAARLMLKHRISALPVLDKNKLVGIITESDIFRAFVELVEKMRKNADKNILCC